jgi:Concanavalin A-like lectin/glucanases superfamily
VDVKLLHRRSVSWSAASLAVTIVAAGAAGCSAGPIELASFDRSVLATDLLALWPMDDAVGSVSAADQSGNGHNGAIVGGRSIAGKFGAALHFELGNEVQVPGFDTTPPSWSLALWVQPEFDLAHPAPSATGQQTTRFVTLLSTEAVFSGGWEMNMALTSDLTDNPHYQFGYWVGPGNSDYLTSSCSNPDRPGACLVHTGWTHLAVVVEVGKNVTFYVDGQLADNRPTPAPIKMGNGILYMGRWQTMGNRLFKGDLDDVAIYRRALTPAEVLALFDGAVPLPGRP